MNDDDANNNNNDGNHKDNSDDNDTNNNNNNDNNNSNIGNENQQIKIINASWLTVNFENTFGTHTNVFKIQDLSPTKRHGLMRITVHLRHVQLFVDNHLNH